MYTFAERLKDLRTERSLTQDQLSKLTSVPVRSIIRYETGETTPSSSTARNNGNTNLIALANFFGVYEEWLLTGKGFKSEWEELQESAKTHTTHKWVVDARLKARNELSASILKYYKIGNPPNPIANNINMTHKQWEQAEKESHARNDLINSIFNYMDKAVARYIERISEK